MIAAVILSLAGLWGGFTLKNNIQNTISSMPPLAWAGIILLLILILLPKRK